MGTRQSVGLYVHQIGGLGMKIGWVRKVYVFEKWTSAPTSGGTHLSYCVGPLLRRGRRGTIMEKKKTPQTAVAPSRNQCRSEKAVVGRLYMPQKYGSLAFVVEEMGPMDMRHSLEGAMD